MKYDWDKNWLDLYEILEISRNASLKEIKKSYKKLARKYHPDLFNDANEDKINYVKQKFQEINLAYEVLSDEKEKDIYDKIYDAKINKTYTEESDNSDIDYDDVMSKYNEASKRASDRLSVLEVITEELEQAKLYLEKKNEVLINAYIEGIDKNEYFLDIHELQQLAYDYINKLDELALIAYDYDLLDTIGLIDETKELMIKEFEKLPNNEDEIILSISKDLIEEKLKKDIVNLRSSFKETIKEIDGFLIECSTSKIIPLEFSNKRSILESKVSDKIDYFDKLSEICKELELEDYYKHLTSFYCDLISRLNILPITHSEAVKQGRIINLKLEKNNIEILIKNIEQIIKDLENLNTNNWQEKYKEGKKIIEKLAKTYANIKRTKAFIINCDFDTEIGILNKEVEEIFASANTLYEEMVASFKQGSVKITNVKAGKPLPTSIFYEGIKKERELAEKIRLYHLIRESQVKDILNEDIDLYNDKLEEAVKQYKDFNDNKSNNTQNQQSSSVKNNNYSNSNHYNNQNNFFEEIEEEFLELLKTGTISNLWYDACDYSWWQNATWENFFTGERADILLDCSKYLPKYINEMSFLFYSIMDKQDMMNLGDINESDFFGQLMLIDFLEMKYKKLLLKKYSSFSFMVNSRDKNFGTPYKHAMTKLLNLWMQKRHEIIISQIDNYKKFSIITNRYDDFIEFTNNLDFNKYNDYGLETIHPSIYTFKLFYKRELENIIEKWEINIRGILNNEEANLKRQYHKVKQAGIINNLDNSFEDLEPPFTTLPKIFEKYKKIIYNERDFIILAKNQITRIKLSILLAYIKQQLDKKEDNDDNIRKLNL